MFSQGRKTAPCIWWKAAPERALPGRKERLRLAVVGPGSVVGEGAFFLAPPTLCHRADQRAEQAVGTARPCASPSWYNRQPAVALALTMAVGSVLAKRLGNRKRRVAAT